MPTWLYIVLGIAVLGFGGELLVRGASRLALALGIPSMVVGLTVVAFATSMPELVTSAVAKAQGEGEIAIANIVGSNIANLALILGIAGCIRSLPIQAITFQREIPFVLVSAGLFALMVGQHWLGVVGGLVLLAVLVAMTTAQVQAALKERETVRAELEEHLGSDRKSGWSLGQSIGSIVAGLGFLILGGNWLVTGAAKVAVGLGISDRIVGLTIVAIGTSFPELAASVIAVRKGEVDVAVGNILGSCIFNCLAIGGAVGILGATTVAPQLIALDVPVMLGLSGLAAILLWNHRQLSRWEGVVLVCAYLIYLAVLVTRAG